MRLRVRLLRDFEAELVPGGRLSGWERPSAWRLLALLAMTDARRLQREVAAAALFPRLAPARAANALAKALSMARRVFAERGVEVLLADRACVWIADEVAVETDLAAHEHALGEALALPSGAARVRALEAALEVAGELLPAERYADWTLEPRRRLDALRGRARRELAGELELLGAPQERRRAAWERVLESEPGNREALAGLVGLQLASDGGRAGAAADGMDAGDVSRVGGRVSVGRELELARLRRALGEVPAGSAASVLLTGPAGIGKTHVLEELLKTLQRENWLVLQGTAVEGDRDVPFAALRAALRPLAGATAPGTRLRSLLVDGGTSRSGEPEQAPEEARAQLAAELAELLEAASLHAPVALALDDCHWIDADLAGLLPRLAETGQPRRWALLVVSRSDEPQAPPQIAWSERLELRPLSRPLIEQLLTTLLEEGTPARQVRELARRSGGNPFYAVELARARRERDMQLPSAGSVPAAIVGLLRRRLDRCSSVAQRLCELVALLADEAAYELVLRLAAVDRELGPAAVRPAAEELLARQLLVEQPGGLRVAHPLVADAIVERMSALARGELHGLIAEACEQLPATTGPAARHRLAAFACVPTRAAAAAAARAGLAAGLEARAVYADAAAANLLGQGLAALAAAGIETQRALHADALSGRLTLGEILAERGELEQAAEHFEAALALAETDAERTRAWSAVAGIPYRRGDLTAAIGCYRQGLRELKARHGAARARLVSDLAWARYRLQGPDGVLATLRESAETLRAAGDHQGASRGFDRLAIALSRTGATKEALASSDAAFACCARGGDEREQGILRLHRAAILCEAGRTQDGLVELDRAAQGVRGSLYLRSVLHWIEADLHEQRGDLEHALAASEQELGLLERLGNERNRAQAHARRARLLALLGRSEESDAAAAQARAAAAASDDVLLRARIDALLAGNDAGIVPA